MGFGTALGIAGGIAATAGAGLLGAGGASMPGKLKKLLKERMRLMEALEDPLSHPAAAEYLRQVDRDLANMSQQYKRSMQRALGRGVGVTSVAQTSEFARRRDEMNPYFQMHARRGELVQDRIGRALAANQATLGMTQPFVQSNVAGHQSLVNTLSAIGQGMFGLAGEGVFDKMFQGFGAARPRITSAAFAGTQPLSGSTRTNPYMMPEFKKYPVITGVR